LHLVLLAETVTWLQYLTSEGKDLVTTHLIRYNNKDW